LFEVRPDYSGSSNYICFERTENPFVIGVARQYALDFFKGNEKARFLRRHSTQQITAVEFDTVIRLLDDAIKEASKNGHGLINSHFSGTNLAFIFILKFYFHSGANIIEGQFATKIESPVRFSLLAGTIKTRVGNVISTLHRFALMIAAACNSMNAISPQ
jgi:hypothetical protein